MVTAPARRELVRWMQARGMTERRCLAIAGMSPSSLRYQPRPDRNVALRTRIVTLAQRHRRYGVGMIHLKLRQAGEIVNYKRVERLYGLEKLHIRRRRRKKFPVSDRQPLIRPGRANEVWSMDFVFDRAASGRTIKCLVIVDDATHEAVAIVPEHTIGGDHLTRILDAICAQRGTPAVIRTDNGPEFTGKAMLNWAHRKAIALRLIEPGKPNQNAYVESFNGRFRDECLNEHWFVSLAHARVVIEPWRQEYNDERPKRSLGGLTPAQYAKQLAARPITMPENSKSTCY
jgi:putative transposase